MLPLLNAFTRFAREGAAVGRLLAAYGEMEIDLMYCLAPVVGLEKAVQRVYRHRGETKRIDNVEMDAKHYYEQRSLGDDFGYAICAMRDCLEVRNKYSHCQWHDYDGKRLTYVDLEELARRRDPIPDLRKVKHYFVDASQLSAWENYFQNTSRALIYTQTSARVLAGELSNQPVAKPARMTPPPLHIP